MDRIARLREKLPDENTGFLIISENNRFYFTHFRSSDGYLIISKKKTFFLTDFRYIENARNVIDGDIDVIEIGASFDIINDICLDNSIRFMIIEDDYVTLSQFERLKRRLTPELLSEYELGSKILELRMIKSSEEIDKISCAQKIAERAYYETLNIIKPGVRERDVSVYLEYQMKRFGAEKVSFDLITITGKNTSLPHGVPSDTTVKDGDFFTFDIGAVYDGYCSDMTRTIAIGHCSEKQREIYDIVLNAHNEAFKMIVKGEKASNVDKAARDYIDSFGYGRFFGHSTGHGVGIDIHERPAVSMRDNTVLMPNMVITDEPGIYLENEFGVRIEDMYRVTDGEAVSFASVDKQLFILD